MLRRKAYFAECSRGGYGGRLQTLRFWASAAIPGETVAVPASFLDYLSPLSSFLGRLIPSDTVYRVFSQLLLVGRTVTSNLDF